MRKGDFSELLSQGIIVYDPMTAQTVGARVVRQPFPGNIIPPTASIPSRAKVLSYYPLPNETPSASLQDNFVYENPRTDTFNSHSIRVDHSITSKQRLFARYTRNDRRESRGAELGTVNGIVPRGNFLFRKNDGVTVDHTYAQSASSLWDIRGGWQLFREPNVRQHEGALRSGLAGIPAVGLESVRRSAIFPALRFRHDQ